MSQPVDVSDDFDIVGWSIAEHLAARRRGVPAEAAIRAVLAAFERLADPAILIGGPLTHSAIAMARALDAQDVSALPLHGVPFVVKDNIDVAGVPTTCGCPSYAYTPTQDSTVVARLRALGAIPVAKTNLDQFATGLVGTRSPYGTPRNPLDAQLIPGGSSSGSAVAVALGLVPFSLGTDTAGSGRVPAAMCGIVGLKPTVGRLPSRGIVPAVRRLDCASVFARSIADARMVAEAAEGWDWSDPYSRPPGEPGKAVRRLGVPSASDDLALEPAAAAAFGEAVAVARRHGIEIVDVDIADFLEAGRLLYSGAFVAERTASVGDFLSEAGADADPSVRSIIAGGAALSAVDAYRSEYRLADIRARLSTVWETFDALLLPTTTGVATLAEVAADPIGVNTRMGAFTTFANLLDLAVVSFPLGDRPDAKPSGVQLIGPAWSDAALADLAGDLLGEPRPPAALRRGEYAIAVVGAHLSAMALNHQLTSRGARLVRATVTAPHYRFFALAATVPPKPGLLRVADGGASIAIEVWALTPSAFAAFVAEVPPPLAIGSLELADGSWVKGFVCEPIGLGGATDITAFGGWRAYIETTATTPQHETSR